MGTNEIYERLFAEREEKYAAFQRKLIPTVAPESIIGIRTPELRKYAKELSGRPDIGGFLAMLPHRYFEENQLHAFILSGIRDFDECLRGVAKFLPYVDNWATCDQMSPKIFKKYRRELLVPVKAWLESKHEYTVRFAIGMLMEHYLDDGFLPIYPQMVAGVRRDEYYVRMMQAWYFATALVKQYEAVIPYLQELRLERWVHNKAIQKAIESYRITDDRKSFLKGMKIK